MFSFQRHSKRYFIRDLHGGFMEAISRCLVLGNEEITTGAHSRKDRRLSSLSLVMCPRFVTEVTHVTSHDHCSFTGFGIIFQQRHI